MVRDCETPDGRLTIILSAAEVSAVNGRVLTLDRAPDASAADRMIVNLPSGVSQSRTIQSITGNKVTVTTAYSETPVAEAVWVIESDELYAQQSAAEASGALSKVSTRPFTADIRPPRSRPERFRSATAIT